MRAGQLDRRIAIWRMVDATEPLSGQPSANFVFWKSVWAGYSTEAVDEVFEGNSRRNVTRTVFKIRYLPELLDTAQIHYHGKIYKIVGIAEIGRKEGLELKTEIYE